MVMQIAWLDSIFEVPDSWEVTRYSIASQTGRIEFTGREGNLGVFSWEKCKRLPDEKRILTEYYRNYLKEYDKEGFKNFKELNTSVMGKFIAGIPDEGQPLNAVTHLAEENKMIMWNFPSYSPKKEKIWRPILESFRPNNKSMRRWSMFGINCELPKEFELDDALCKPADVWLNFEHKNLHKIFMHRWGLPREILRFQDLEDYFGFVIRGHEGKVLTSQKETFRGMDSVFITAEIKGVHGFERLYGSQWPGEGRLWHNEKEKRLYAICSVCPSKGQTSG
jgi:hypothetical protein